MPDISEKMLATQLNDLEADGILSRTIVSAKPLHIEYALAPDQQELCRALADLCEFSKNYAAKNNIALPAAGKQNPWLPEFTPTAEGVFFSLKKPFVSQRRMGFVNAPLSGRNRHLRKGGNESSHPQKKTPER